MFLNVNVPELPVHQHNLYVHESQCDMFLNLKVISKTLNVPELPVHQHNFHVPECPCDEDAPENENDLTSCY